jgi:hypothetical protein
MSICSSNAVIKAEVIVPDEQEKVSLIKADVRLAADLSFRLPYLLVF